MEMEPITVVAAIIEHRGRFLLLKRAPHKENAGLWEFPGGKVQPGESLQGAITREIKEEIGVGSTADRLLGTCEVKGLRLHGVEVVLDQPPIKNNLVDHTEFAWVKSDEFLRYPMTEAELVLINSLGRVLESEVEVTHINVWSVARMYGFVHAIIGVFLGFFVLATSFFSWLPFQGFRTALAVFLPFIYGVFGLFIGAMFAWFYNTVATVIGGMKMKLK